MKVTWVDHVVFINTTSPIPIYHYTSEWLWYPAGGRSVYRTACGRETSTSSATVIQTRHAEKFGRLCQRCARA